MKRKFHTPEQIVNKPREADAIIASGGTVEQACRKLEISVASSNYPKPHPADTA